MIPTRDPPKGRMAKKNKRKKEAKAKGKRSKKATFKHSFASKTLKKARSQAIAAATDALHEEGARLCKEAASKQHDAVDDDAAASSSSTESGKAEPQQQGTTAGDSRDHAYEAAAQLLQHCQHDLAALQVPIEALPQKASNAKHNYTICSPLKNGSKIEVHLQRKLFRVMKASAGKLVPQGRNFTFGKHGGPAEAWQLAKDASGWHEIPTGSVD